jgi:hypothetical protein
VNFSRGLAVRQPAEIQVGESCVVEAIEDEVYTAAAEAAEASA